MENFKQGEQVRIIESTKNLSITFTINEIKESCDGKPLYFLKSQDDESVLRLYYENGNSSLRRVD
jgi:hypothetical protein